jgi:hypothetical protein
MNLISNTDKGALVKGKSYPLLKEENGRYTIKMGEWKVSQLKSNFEPLIKTRGGSF